MAANGRGNEAILQKIGMMDRPDLSEIEAVQMGHIMQPVIGRLAENKLKMELKDADYSLAFSSEPWLKSHFDFISADGSTLVEAKNYGMHKRNRFDADANIIPADDMAQLIHEAACHNVSRIVLAVLFGGQEFQTFDFTISDFQKEELVKDMAEFWGRVVTKNPLPPETSDQARFMYATDSGTSVMANPQIEKISSHLKALKNQIKELEAEEEKYQVAIHGYMGSNAELITPDGKIIATWKNAKASKRFDPKLFSAAMPDLYNQFIVEAPGSRRFLVK
jgi:predicted phage-related endonuclease